ncbi:MAG TPA: DUF4114 domain-containing protein [Pyrinomonadaceae bacterium]|nr:DUF4114 domain-containing protein [Pyrinomonadaceae bacterium]
MSRFTAPRLIACTVIMLSFSLYEAKVHAADLTLTVGGKVSIELVSSDAAFSNTLSVVSPTGIAIATIGCQIEASPELTGLKIVSEKQSQHGCRVDLDSNPAVAGIQPFPAGTTFRFNMCSQSDADPNCENVWSSNPGSNSDGFDHVQTTPIRPAEFPGQIFQLGWEDLPGGGDMDFNDLVAVFRASPDTDGDGLWDDWEQFGIDTDGNGTIDLDLPNLLPVDLNGDGDTTDPGERTSPNRKDIFLEIDFMDCAVAGGDCLAGDTHTHRPNATVINAVVRAFANAAVNNPDGSSGITLHIDVSNAIPHQSFLNIPGLCFPAGAGIGSFDAVKANPANFGPNNPRRFAFHYSLFTHLQTNDTTNPNQTSSGCGEFPGNDFQVSMGGFTGSVGTLQQHAGTLMHEFGHNLNLGDGGGDSVNRKPNYLSIMSYRYQLSGIPPTDPDGAGPLTARIDYSRSALASLNETSLNEPAGIGDGADTAFFRCPSGFTGSGVGNGPLDWNCDGDTADTAINNDINGDGATSTLIGFNDWGNLLYDFQRTGSFADGEHSLSTRVVEVDTEVYLQEIAPELSLTMTASPNPVVTGSNITYTLTVQNNRPEAATSVVVTDVLPPQTTFVSCSAPGGVCGGSGNARTVSYSVVPGGTAVTIQLVAAVLCPVANGTSIANTATVSSVSPDSDFSNNIASAIVTASNPAPVISNAAVSIPVLLPVNHSLTAIVISYDVTDNCGPITNTLRVSSNEPVNAVGDGNTAPDWEIVDAHHVRLRAERSGTGTGRIYTITITSTDSAGNSTSSDVFVTVPHDRGPIKGKGVNRALKESPTRGQIPSRALLQMLTTPAARARQW